MLYLSVPLPVLRKPVKQQSVSCRYWQLPYCRKMKTVLLSEQRKTAPFVPYCSVQSYSVKHCCSAQKPSYPGMNCSGLQLLSFAK